MTETNNTRPKRDATHILSRSAKFDSTGLSTLGSMILGCVKGPERCKFKSREEFLSWAHKEADYLGQRYAVARSAGATEGSKIFEDCINRYQDALKDLNGYTPSFNSILEAHFMRYNPAVRYNDFKVILRNGRSDDKSAKQYLAQFQKGETADIKKVEIDTRHYAKLDEKVEHEAQSFFSGFAAD